MTYHDAEESSLEHTVTEITAEGDASMRKVARWAKALLTNNHPDRVVSRKPCRRCESKGVECIWCPLTEYCAYCLLLTNGNCEDGEKPKMKKAKKMTKEKYRKAYHEALLYYKDAYPREADTGCRVMDTTNSRKEYKIPMRPTVFDFPEGKKRDAAIAYCKEKGMSVPEDKGDLSHNGEDDSFGEDVTQDSRANSFTEENGYEADPTDSDSDDSDDEDSQSPLAIGKKPCTEDLPDNFPEITTLKDAKCMLEKLRRDREVSRWQVYTARRLLLDYREEHYKEFSARRSAMYATRRLLPHGGKAFIVWNGTENGDPQYGWANIFLTEGTSEDSATVEVSHNREGDREAYQADHEYRSVMPENDTGKPEMERRLQKWFLETKYRPDAPLEEKSEDGDDEGKQGSEGEDADEESGKEDSDISMIDANA